MIAEQSLSVGTRNQAERETWLQRTLAALPAGARLLDAGAGEMQYKRFCGHLRYVSQDIAQYDGRGDGSGLHTGEWRAALCDYLCDITAIPEPDESFDAVMCIEVLEHLPDPVAALRELARVLRPGGVMILTAPFCSFTHFAPQFYQTGYSRYFYEHWLPRLGIDVEEIACNGNYFEFLAQELRRLPTVRDRYAARRMTPAQREGVAAVLGLLQELSDADRGSSELLCFGLHVRGRKR